MAQIGKNAGTPASDPAEHGGDGAQTVKRARKVYMACSWCRKQKLKCDGRQPCHRCQSSSRGASCHYDDEEEGHPAHRQANYFLFGDIVNRLDRLEGSIERVLHLAQSTIGPSQYGHQPAGSLSFHPRHEYANRGFQETEQINAALRHSMGAPNYRGMTNRFREGHSSPSSSSPHLEKRSTGPESTDKWNSSNLRGSHGPFTPFVQGQSETAPSDHEGGIVHGPRPTKPQDPITAGLLNYEQAEQLLQHYMEYINPYLPILDQEETTLAFVKKTSSFLLCAMLAISCRFFQRYSNLFDPVADLVDSHVSHTLLSATHNLQDVQACLILTAYGLRKRGVGVDPWVLSGHTIRLASRLRLDKVRLPSETHPDYKKERSKHLTMLMLFVLDTSISYGFGRPLTRWPMGLGFLDTSLLMNSRHRQSQDVFASAFSILVKIPLSVMSFLDCASEYPQNDFEYRDRLLQEMTMAYDYLISWEDQWLLSGISRELIPPHAYTLNLIRDHIFITLDSLAKDMTSMHKADDESANMAFQLFDTLRNKAITNAVGLSHNLASEPDESFVAYAPDYATICNAQAALFLVRISDSMRSKAWQHDERRQDLWRRAEGLVKSIARLDKSICQMGVYMSQRVEAIMTSRSRIPALAATSGTSLVRSNGQTGTTPNEPTYAASPSPFHPPPLSAVNSICNSSLSQESTPNQLPNMDPSILDNQAWDAAIFGQLWDPGLVSFMSLLEKPAVEG